MALCLDGSLQPHVQRLHGVPVTGCMMISVMPETGELTVLKVVDIGENAPAVHEGEKAKQRIETSREALALAC